LTCALDNLSIKDGFDQSSLIIQNSIRGIEKKPLPHLLCSTNLILHGIEKPATTRGNLLTKKFDSWKGSNQVSIVLSNPPFGGQSNLILLKKLTKVKPTDFSQALGVSLRAWAIL